MDQRRGSTYLEFRESLAFREAPNKPKIIKFNAGGRLADINRPP